MKYITVTFIFIFMFLTKISAFRGHVVDTRSEPVVGASVFLLRSDSTVDQTTITDASGFYTLTVTKYPVQIVIRSMGFKTVHITIDKKPADTVETILEDEDKTLNEIVVTPEMMQRYDSHNSYRLTQKEMAMYPTFAQAMNVIPFVNVQADGAMTYRGKSDIVVLLNGVRTTTAEIRALDKGDVMKVDVYENPPAQYALDGASAVVNIITRRRVTGGNVAVDLKDSFHPLKGINNVSAFFNTGQSRFSLLLGNEMSHYKKTVTDESLVYELGGTEYSKIKKGTESPYNRDDNSLSLGFMTHRQDSWQLNANLSVSAYKLDKDLQQTISYSDRNGQYCGENSLYNRYNKQSLNLYFTKSWKNGRQLLVDVTGTLFNTLYSSTYNEWDMQTQENTFNSASAYKTGRRSLLSTVQYTTRGPLGSWTFGVKDTYQYGKQKQTGGNLVQNENTLYGYAQLYGHKDKFYYQLIAAAKYLDIQQDNRNVWSKWYPLANPTPVDCPG